MFRVCSRLPRSATAAAAAGPRRFLRQFASSSSHYHLRLHRPPTFSSSSSSLSFLHRPLSSLYLVPSSTTRLPWSPSSFFHPSSFRFTSSTTSPPPPLSSSPTSSSAEPSLAPPSVPAATVTSWSLRGNVFPVEPGAVVAPVAAAPAAAGGGGESFKLPGATTAADAGAGAAVAATPLDKLKHNVWVRRTRQWWWLAAALVASVGIQIAQSRWLCNFFPCVFFVFFLVLLLVCS